MTDAPAFLPLRTCPPPTLGTLLWIRSALVLTILATSSVVVVGDVAADRSRHVEAVLVAALHVGVLALLVVWSYVAMTNVDALVPATRYTKGARGAIAGGLWVAALLTPVGAVAVVARIRSGFGDAEAFGPTMLAIAVVLLALLAAWLPFRYHVRQAARIGAPHSIMLAWFWAPVVTFVVGLSVLGFVYAPRLGSGPIEQPLGIGAVYGVAIAVFGLSTWRAVTVFDEVIDLRWRRWKVEWEQTLAEMVAQPPPGPELGGST